MLTSTVMYAFGGFIEPINDVYKNFLLKEARRLLEYTEFVSKNIFKNKRTK